MTCKTSTISTSQFGVSTWNIGPPLSSTFWRLSFFSPYTESAWLGSYCQTNHDFNSGSKDWVHLPSTLRVRKNSPHQDLRLSLRHRTCPNPLLSSLFLKHCWWTVSFSVGFVKVCDLYAGAGADADKWDEAQIGHYIGIGNQRFILFYFFGFLNGFSCFVKANISVFLILEGQKGAFKALAKWYSVNISGWIDCKLMTFGVLGCGVRCFKFWNKPH